MKLHDKIKEDDFIIFETISLTLDLSEVLVEIFKFIDNVYYNEYYDFELNNTIERYLLNTSNNSQIVGQEIAFNFVIKNYLRLKMIKDTYFKYVELDLLNDYNIIEKETLNDNTAINTNKQTDLTNTDDSTLNENIKQENLNQFKGFNSEDFTDISKGTKSGNKEENISTSQLTQTSKNITSENNNKTYEAQKEKTIKGMNRNTHQDLFSKSMEIINKYDIISMLSDMLTDYLFKSIQ